VHKGSALRTETSKAVHDGGQCNGQEVPTGTGVLPPENDFLCVCVCGREGGAAWKQMQHRSLLRKWNASEQGEFGGAALTNIYRFGRATGV